MTTPSASAYSQSPGRTGTPCSWTRPDQTSRCPRHKARRRSYRHTPNQRGTPDSNGTPTTLALYASDANEATVKIPAAQTADQALELKPTQFQMRWGSKQIPEVPIKGGELIYHAKMAQGVESLREGFGMQPSFDAGRRIFQMNLEAYPAHLSEQGLSSRAVESIQCIIQDGGTDAIHAVRAYLTLVYEQLSLIHI